MPGPYMRRLEHRRGEIVTGAFVDRVLAIVLPIWLAQRVGAEVSSMPGNVVAVLVVDDSGIVRSDRAVRSPRRFHHRAMVVQARAAGTEMDLAAAGDR